MRGIRDHYKSLGKDVDGAFTRAAKQTSQIFWQLSQTEVASVGGPKITKYDPDYAKEVFDRIHPDSSAGFAAVQTDKMRASDMRQIRQALVEAQQESALTGLTARARQKLLGEKLATLAGGLDSWKFIDKSGKRWKNNNYFNMLNRTTLARVSRDSYQDSLIESKLDLVMVQNAGDPCPTCTRWNGVIYSITGTTKGFPSYNDAVLAGVFHPNCVCLPVYVDTAADEEIIDAQEGTPNPGKATPEEWNKYATRIEAQALPKVGVKRPDRPALKTPKPKDEGKAVARAEAEGVAPAKKKIRKFREDLTEKKRDVKELERLIKTQEKTKQILIKEAAERKRKAEEKRQKKIKELEGLVSAINRGDKKVWDKDPRLSGVKNISDLAKARRSLIRKAESLKRVRK